MARLGEIDQITIQRLTNLTALRNEEERLQELEARCRDQVERQRINANWNRLEEMQDEAIHSLVNDLEAYRRTINRTLRLIETGEQSYAQMRQNGSAASAVNTSRA